MKFPTQISDAPKYFSKSDIQLESQNQWKLLEDSEILRHALMHACGNVTLMKTKDQLETVVSNQGQRFEIENGRIYPTETLLQDFATASSDFVEWIEVQPSGKANETDSF